MGKSKDLATGETRFVNAAGDTMTGNLGINETSPSGSLHVKGTSSTHGKIILGAGGSGGSANNNFMEFNKHDGTKLGELEVGESVTNGGSLVFKTTPSGGSATSRMTINHDGYVTMPNQPCFLANGNQGGWQTVSQGNTSTVAFHQEQFDQGNCYNNSTMRFVAPVAGKYLLHFSAYVRLESNDDDTNHAYTRIQKNGSNYAETFYIYGYVNNGDADQQTTITVIMDMAANDYAMCSLSAASGSASYYQPGCQFMGYLVA